MKRWLFDSYRRTKEDDAMSMASEVSRISFELIRHNIDPSMSLDRKVIRYTTKTISEPIYEDEISQKSNYGDIL